jgi:four helix bundle protein
MAFMFEKLHAYQQAVNLADQASKVTEDLPRGYYYLADQLNRAALSVATNLAEGNGRFTKADRKHFFTIARGSAQECVPILEVARRRGLLADDMAAAMNERIEITARMISGLISRMGKRKV